MAELGTFCKFLILKGRDRKVFLHIDLRHSVGFDVQETVSFGSAL
jgi:hypothetical protein